MASGLLVQNQVVLASNRTLQMSNRHPPLAPCGGEEPAGRRGAPCRSTCLARSSEERVKQCWAAGRPLMYDEEGAGAGAEKMGAATRKLAVGTAGGGSGRKERDGGEGWRRRGERWRRGLAEGRRAGLRFRHCAVPYLPLRTVRPEIDGRICVNRCDVTVKTLYRCHCSVPVHIL